MSLIVDSPACARFVARLRRIFGAIRSQIWIYCGTERLRFAGSSAHSRLSHVTTLTSSVERMLHTVSRTAWCLTPVFDTLRIFGQSRMEFQYRLRVPQRFAHC